MYVVGLTGGIGSGKSTVANQFSNLGVVVIDADRLSREAVMPGSKALAAISEHFGRQVLSEDGALNRKALREIVFSDETERHWLEALLHPLIAQLIRVRINNTDSLYCILESPLLLETAQKDLVNRVLVVDVSENTQLQRTLARDGGSKSMIRAIIESQMKREGRCALADDIINNEQAPEFLEQRVAELHQMYLGFAGSDGENENR